MTAQPPFEAIPAAAARVLRPVLPALADETIAAIAREVPGYARAMEGNFGQIVRMGVEVAFGRFVDSIEDPSQVDDFGRETYVNLGRGELHAGRSLDALLAAYRVGARLAWRRFVDAGTAGGLPPEVLYRLGEAIFAYVDELSAESAEGYALEQMAEAGERRARRRRLVALLAEEPAPTDEIRAAAAAAGWELPRSLAAVVTGAGDGNAEDPDDTAEWLARRLGHGAVGAAVGGLACAMLVDPGAPARRRQLAAALGGARAALGPPVPWPRAWESVRRATATYQLLARGRVTADRDGIAPAEAHLAALLLNADANLASDLASARLAPLAGLAPGQRERLLATLRAWLDRPGQVQAVAAQLAVHPQTVRYRLARLRELFGGRLDDPDARFELALALRAGA